MIPCITIFNSAQLIRRGILEKVNDQFVPGDSGDFNAVGRRVRETHCQVNRNIDPGELSKTIKNIKTTDTSDKHNGMPHYSEGGTGDVDGTTIEWSVDVLAAKRVVIILTFAAPGIAEKR